MIIDEVYRFVQDVLSKDQKGYATPGEFNRAFKAASEGLFKQRYGLPEHYREGRPVPGIAYAMTQKLEDDMRPFKIRTTLNIDELGIAQLPSDYAHVIAIRKKVKVRNTYCGKEARKNYEYREIPFMPESELSYRLGSSIVAPDAKWPICTFYESEIQFWPDNLISCQFVYLRNPIEAVWGYNGQTGRPVFDPSQSTDTDWPVDAIIDLKVRVVKILAISLREQELAAIMEQTKQQGE